MTFANPWNPSAAEVRAWAYQEDALEPCEDWNLALSWAWHEDIYLEIVADDRCPNRSYFLQLLYFMVGDAVKSTLWPSNAPIVEGLIEKAADYHHPDILEWRSSAAALLEDPASYDDALWRGEDAVT